MWSRWITSNGGCVLSGLLLNERADHSVSYGGVIQSSFAFCLTPVLHTGVMHHCNFDIHFLRDMLLWLQGRQDCCPFLSYLLFSLACGFQTVRLALLDGPHSRDYGKGRSLYLEDKVSISVLSQLV